MRKELLTYVNTNELGEEFSVQSLATDRDFVLINNGGNKFTANVKELQAALTAIKEFDETNNSKELGNA